MKKIIYILMFTIASALTISSCTEEEVVPSEQSNGGGNGSTDGGY